MSLMIQEPLEPNHPVYPDPFLPADVARCDGVGDDTDGWREGCETCLRRTAKRGSWVLMMSPPAIIAFECEYLIEPNTEDRRK